MKIGERKLAFRTTMALVILSLTIGLALGYFIIQRTVLLTFKTYAPRDMQIYSDADCTIPLTSISYGTVNIGSTNGFTFYVKNTGQADIYVYWNSSMWWGDPLVEEYHLYIQRPDTSSWVDTRAGTGQLYIKLEKGAVEAEALQLVINSWAQEKDESFTVTFYAYSSPK